MHTPRIASARDHVVAFARYHAIAYAREVVLVRLLTDVLFGILCQSHIKVLINVEQFRGVDDTIDIEKTKWLVSKRLKEMNRNLLATEHYKLNSFPIEANGCKTVIMLQLQ